MEHILSLLLLLCALTPPELEGATVSLQITPSHSESTTEHAPSNTTMITTTKQSSFAKPSQETHTFTVITEVKTPTQSALELMDFTTQQPSPPEAIPAGLGTQEPNTQKPNSTSEITVNPNQTIGLIDAVNTTPPVSSTTVNHPDLGKKNHTSITTTEQQTREPTLPPGMFSTHRLPTSAASETTTASTLGHTSTSVKIPQKSTTIKSTTKNPAPPVKPRTTSASEQPSETHGIVAAVLIGLILLMMFVGFIFILVKKHRWQRRQLENSEWAGPSPFLDGSSQPHFSSDSTKDGSKRISFVGFLPQNLSKSHSLLDDTDEGLAMDIVPGTTFGQNDTVETKPQNGTAQEDKGEAENEQDHNNTSENPPVTTAANLNPEATAINEDDNSEGNSQETPSVQPSTASPDIPPPPPTTTSPDISSPTPDTDLQSSNDTTPASEVQIPPAPPLPSSLLC
ncbi:hypothetical protein ACEWY4_007870 [Coilia grayii]|uniref:Uncharacterized protein n=1 Tax=Coilia grayii TaxID=363190 RepID=A0ABD1K9A1_9TELE